MAGKDQMLEVVTCKHCGADEYYGAMHWRNGTSMCRQCIYEVWQRESPDWEPKETDYTFPYYSDGLNHLYDYVDEKEDS